MDEPSAHVYIARVFSDDFSRARISRKEASMKSTFAVVVVAAALLVSAADVYAMAWGGGRGRGDSSSSSSESYSGGPSASVPEPSTLYAAGSALGLLAGAGWYIRRRK